MNNPQVDHNGGNYRTPVMPNAPLTAAARNFAHTFGRPGTNSLMKLVTFTVFLLFVCAAAFAHHSGVMFEREKELSLKGTVKEFVFVNPHVSILLAVQDEHGVTTNWSFEAASVQGMVQAGWRKSTLKPGDSVTIVGHPLKDGRPGAQLIRVVLADGTVLKSNAGGNY